MTTINERKVELFTLAVTVKKLDNVSFSVQISAYKVFVLTKHVSVTFL